MLQDIEKHVIGNYWTNETLSFVNTFRSLLRKTKSLSLGKNIKMKKLNRETYQQEQKKKEQSLILDTKN